MPIDHLSVSRRDFLRGSASLAALCRSHGSGLWSNLSMSWGDGWVEIHRNGELAHAVRTAWFSGDGSVWQEQKGTQFSFGLNNARHAGLTLAADVTYEFWPGSFGFQTAVHHHALGLIFQGTAEQWLGEEGLRTILREPLTLLRTNGSKVMVMPGPVALRSDGSLHFSCKATVEVRTCNVRVKSERVEFRPFSGEGERPITKIAFKRALDPWELQVPRGRWTYENESSLFDIGTLEAADGEEPRSFAHNVVFQSSYSERPFRVIPTTPLRGTDGRAVELVMDTPVYTLEPATGSHRFEAQLAKSVSMRFGSLGLHLSAPPNRPALVAANDSGCICTNASLIGQIDTAYITGDSKTDWKLAILVDDKKPIPDYVDATVDMVGERPEIKASLLPLRILRPQDGLDLCLRITNITLTIGAGDIGTLTVAEIKSDLSLLIADLPSQALIRHGIQCSSATATDDCVTDCVAVTDNSYAAAPTRLSMRFLTAQQGPQTLSTDLLLKWAQFPLNLDARAIAAADPKLSNPDTPIPDYASDIALPGWSVSPDETHALFTSPDVREDNGVSQIFSARLSKRLAPRRGTSADGAPNHFPVTTDRRPSLRPIFRRPLQDEQFIFKKGDREYIIDKLRNASAPAQYCVFSPSHGAWLDFGAVFPPTSTIASFHDSFAAMLEERAEISFNACLVPTGHRVQVVRSGRLQFCRTNIGKNNLPVLKADFVMRYKIVYQQPLTMTYAPFRNPKSESNRILLPFDTVTLLGKETPYLDFDSADQFTTNFGTATTSNYWAWVKQPNNVVPYAFPVEFSDRGNVDTLRTTMQMLVACAPQAFSSDTSYRQNVEKEYKSPTSQPGKQTPTPTLNFNGSRVAYAIPSKPGNTSYSTGSMILTAQDLTGADLGNINTPGDVPWIPRMTSATLTLDQVAAITDPLKPTNSQRVFVYASAYQKTPFDDRPSSKNNRAEVMLQLADSNSSPIPTNFNGALGGGLALPTSQVAGLARKTGTIFANATADLDRIADTGMKIADVLAGLGAASSLLGAVHFSDILEDVSDGIAQASKLPLLALQQLHDIEAEALTEIKQEFGSQLATLTSFLQKVQQYATPVEALITQYKQSLSQVGQTAASLVRVLTIEQRDGDVKQLANVQTLDSNVKALTQALIPVLSLSAVQRIEGATQWPPLNATGAKTLPTLPQLRDYALNQLAAAATAEISDAFDTALSSAQDTLQAQLDATATAAANALVPLEDSLLFKFADAADTVVTALSATNLTAEQAADCITALGDLADTVAALPQLQQTITNIAAQTTASVKSVTDAVPNGTLIARAEAMVVAVNQIQGNDTLKSKLLTELGNNGQLITAFAALLKNLTAIANNVDGLATQVVAQETALYADFVAAQGQINQLIGGLRQLLTVPRKLQTSYTYNTSLSSKGLFIANRNGNSATLDISSKVVVPLDGSGSSTSKVDVAVKNFQLNLIPTFPFVIIGFDIASFTCVNGAAPTVNCPISAKNVELVGPLNFVANITSALGLPELQVEIADGGLTVGLNTALPEIASGAFNIVNLSVYTAVKLFFTGDPMQLIFGFANPNQRFAMIYFFLGGGGYVNLQFAPFAHTGGMAVSGALEFGAMAALDFGIAEGEVHIFGGFYMSLRPADLLLSGYYRAGGDFEVLGLISASLEFTMSLSYEDRGGTAWLSGDCELDVDVGVLFFSETVSLHLHHDFCGTAQD